jgi:hypothetical protein
MSVVETVAQAVSASAVKDLWPLVDPMVATAARVAMYGWLQTATRPHCSLFVTTLTDVPAMEYTARAKTYMVAVEKIYTLRFLKALSPRTCIRVKFSQIL